MKKIAALLMCLSLLFFNGCWDARDIGDVDIVLTASVDKAREEDKLRPEDRVLVTFQIPVLDPGAQEKSYIIEATGETVGDTRPERANISFRFLPFTEIQVLLFGEELAREGLQDTLDIVFRNPFLSYKTNLAVVEGYAKDILEIKTVTAPNIGIGLLGLLETTSQQNFVPKVTLHDFRNDEIPYGREPVLPVLSVRKKNVVEISGIAIFNDGRMVGKLDRDEMKYLTLLRGEKTRGTITFPVKEGVKVTLQGTNKRKVNVDMVNGRAYYAIDIFIIADVVEATGGYQLDRDLDRFAETQQAAEAYIEFKCQEIVYQLQNLYRTDALNLGAQARAVYGKTIEEIDADTFFANSEITVNAHVKFRNYGGIR